MVDFPGAGAADQQRARALLEPAAEELIQLRDPGGELRAGAAAAMFGGNQARKYRQTAPSDHIVVEAAAKRGAAIFDHPQAPALGAVLGAEVLQCDHAVRNAQDLQVVFGGGQVVEQDYRAPFAREVLLEREDLPPVAQRVPGDEAQLRQ